MPGAVEGVRVVSRGESFIEWAWLPVEGATGYEADVFPEATPPEEREEPVATVEPTHRRDGLEPGAPYAIWIRAVAENAAGRSLGAWTRGDVGWTATTDSSDTTPPAACGDELARALDYQGAVLPREWSGVPFRYDVIESEDPEVTAYLRDQLDVVDVLAGRIEDRLGYRIIEAGDVIGPLPGLPPDSHRDSRCSSARLPGQIIGFLIPDRPDFHRGGGASEASPWCATVTYFRHEQFDDLRPALAEAVVHELFHDFGFKHDDNDREPENVGIFMSRDLTGRIFETGEDWRVTAGDLDALGCVFPHPDFPR